MATFHELYDRLLLAALKDKVPEEICNIHKENYDPHHLDCLLHPDKHPVVVRLEDCKCAQDCKASCMGKCQFDALYQDENGNIAVRNDMCVGCGECVNNCRAEVLMGSKDVIPALDAVYHSDAPVYVMIAPAFVNQFSEEVTPGKLRTAFKKIGFAGMIEVALFADILTLKEALEFDKHIVSETDFQLTSCCCPMWIAMIRKVYHQLVTHVPGSVSPMVACGRSIKALYPHAKTVFIGPCIAKKAEARDKDIADAVDHVLTFQEARDIFEFAGIELAELPEDERDHSSRAGRIYATTGGVSEAVQSTVQRLNPTRPISVKTVHADGVAACKSMLNEILSGKINGNFYEGMGCVHGCVGGPKVLIPKEKGRENVYAYGDKAEYPTPIDNPYVIELLHRLGFDTVESLLENSDIFTRHFENK